MKQGFLRRLRRLTYIGFSIFVWWFALTAVNASVPSTKQTQEAAFAMTVSGWNFDLIGWEVKAIREKIQAYWTQPAAKVPPAESAQWVDEYMERARQIGGLEGEINRILSEDNQSGNVDALQKEVDALRQQQETTRVAVEQIIEQQVEWALADEGIGVIERTGVATQSIWQSLGLKLWPPVYFGFVEPPKKMIISPRDRIETIYGRMVGAEIPLEVIESSEKTIYDEHNLSAYITNIGGLGAYPAMVVDRASLEWVLSTVAHEWVHNYLTFFPLGFNYLKNAEIMTINETVADIVGNEIGDKVLRTFYPDLIPPDSIPPLRSAPAIVIDGEIEDGLVLSAPVESHHFDFATEMRMTRLQVDRYLEEGKVEEAEAYMEQRRQAFVEHGYPLRVLNQAYFAFHGSYGTSAASTDPIGPTLKHLRELSPDLKTFLVRVRDLMSLSEIEAEIEAEIETAIKSANNTELIEFNGFAK
ncbi:MAG: hypothetical protein AAF639_05920 [Chloroflexota bacterium]